MVATFGRETRCFAFTPKPSTARRDTLSVMLSNRCCGAGFGPIRRSFYRGRFLSRRRLTEPESETERSAHRGLKVALVYLFGGWITRAETASGFGLRIGREGACGISTEVARLSRVPSAPLSRE